jgi:hypothetical protein
MIDWANLASRVAAPKRDDSAAAAQEQARYRSANADVIRRVVKGIGIDSGRRSAASGARVVFNIACAHVRAMLANKYLNGYDLAKARIGSQPPKPVSDRRRAIDTAVAKCAGGAATAESLYYAALEINGAGMRYYGDMCLVLRADKVKDETLVLFRNSYDLDREPIRSRVGGNPDLLEDEALALSGRWPNDVADMAVCKLLDGAAALPRLMTTGAVSEGVLADEDYIEIPRVVSFGAGDLAEIRTSAADAAFEALIANRETQGPSTTFARLLWRARRRDAERAARERGVDLRVVGTHGRVRA